MEIRDDLTEEAAAIMDRFSSHEAYGGLYLGEHLGAGLVVHLVKGTPASKELRVQIRAMVKSSAPLKFKNVDYSFAELSNEVGQIAASLTEAQPTRPTPLRRRSGRLRLVHTQHSLEYAPRPGSSITAAARSSPGPLFQILPENQGLSTSSPGSTQQLQTVRYKAPVVGRFTTIGRLLESSQGLQ